MSILIRIGVGMVLLGMAWEHSHWSVAAILTLMALRCEIRSLAGKVGMP